MTIQHKDLSGSDLHEPKGIETATSGEVYVANGSGSGSWDNVLAAVKNLNKFYRDTRITDIGNAGDNSFIVIPDNCTLTKVRAVLDDVISTTDCVISFYRAGVLLGQTMTLPVAGSAAGVAHTLTLSPTYTFTAGQTLELRSDGGPTNAQVVNFVLEFTAS